MPSTKSERPLWALVDCNNFFASCERLFRPDLEGKPVVVLSNNDGCIVARSNEAKALGIGMGEPEFKARPVLQKHGVKVFSSNYALYGDISCRIMATLESLCPRVEQYSIDEAFVRLDGALHAQAGDTALALRHRVRQWTGIQVSVGIAPTRTLAKLANHVAKKGSGVHCLTPADPTCDEILARLPVGEVWGMGRRLVQKLHAVGITSALGLKQANDVWVRKNLTVVGWRTVLELRGMPCIGEEQDVTPTRTVVSSRSFGQRVFSREHLAEAVATFTARGAARLRRKGLLARGLAVHIRTARHDAEVRRDVVEHITLPLPTAHTPTLIEAGHRALDAIFHPGYAYAKAGIMLYDLERVDCRQGNLLALARAPQDARHEALMQAMDSINARFGRDVVRFAAQGPEDAPWHMRQNHCSPRSTTVWEELAQAHCR